MGRYKNRTITLEFPDLSEDGDAIFVTIRNPKTVSLDGLTADTDVVGENSTSTEQKQATYRMLAGLVVDWHVYDSAQEDGDALPLPATAESLASLPFEITNKLMDEVGQVMRPPT